MKRAMSIMAILLAASLAVGQSTASKPAAAPAKTKTAKNTSAKPATAAAPAKAAPQAAAKNKSATSHAKPAAPKAAVSKPAAKAKPVSVKPAAKPAAKAAAPKPAAKPVAKPAVAKAKAPAKPAAEAAAAPAQGTGAQAASRRRDPFINPITAVREGLSTACQGGKRCLEVTEIILRGIVRAPTGMIAVVENAAQRTYFLRENDPIYNGFVQKITPDTVVFKEHFIDSLGRDNQREIVKTVNAPVV